MQGPNKGLKNESNANKGTTVVKPTVTAELEVNGVNLKILIKKQDLQTKQMQMSQH